MSHFVVFIFLFVLDIEKTSHCLFFDCWFYLIKRTIQGLIRDTGVECTLMSFLALWESREVSSSSIVLKRRQRSQLFV